MKDTKRTIGVKHTYLVLPAEKEGLLIGSIVAAVDFVDDYRPARPQDKYAKDIDRRYARIDQMGGCIWYSDTKDFSTKEEGNEFYKQKLVEGYVVGTEKQWREFTNRCAALTY